jgi:hypothetical protein
MLLFLDFDGVLHPDAVYLRRGRAELGAEGQLFMWAHYLQAVVEEADVQIVLSTSWARHLLLNSATLSLSVRFFGAYALSRRFCRIPRWFTFPADSNFRKLCIGGCLR